MQIYTFILLKENGIVMLYVNIHVLLVMFMNQRKSKCILKHLITKASCNVYYFHTFPSNNFAVISERKRISTIEIAIQLVNVKLINIIIGNGYGDSTMASHFDKLIISTKCTTYTPNEI